MRRRDISIRLHRLDEGLDVQVPHGATAHRLRSCSRVIPPLPMRRREVARRRMTSRLIGERVRWKR